MKTLKKIIQMDKNKLQEFCSIFIKEKGYKVIETDKYLYGKGDIPVMLVAHLDTVHTVPEQVFTDTQEKIMWSPTGIGGDDRCGVYAVLKLLGKYKPYVLFTQDEEIGCIGANEFIEDIKQPDIKYIIELDRRGEDDCVFYDCGNEEFQAYVETFGFTTKHGSYTDIRAISKIWDVASVNLSVGYQNEHTISEFINFENLQKTIKKVASMLDDIDSVSKFDLRKKTQVYHYYYNNNKTGEEEFLDYKNY